MKVVFFLVIAAIIAGIIIKKASEKNTPGRRSGQKARNYKGSAIDRPLSSELEQTLGLKIPEGKPLAEKLEHAWNRSLEVSVKARLIEKGMVSDESFSWYQLELKRFFILSAIMKNVPMYSAKVDAIWHDMILFTKDYAAFCEQFHGTMIHHTPTDKAKITRGASQHERAVFELVYSVLFTEHDYTETIQGPFGKTLLRKSFVEKWQNAKGKERETYLQQELFEAVPEEYEPLIYALTKKLAELLEEAEEHVDRRQKTRSKTIMAARPEDQTPVLLLSYSILALHEPIPEDNNYVSSGGYYDRDDRDDRYDHHDSGNDSSCSSDSGSGSSCSSSSCGGSS
ncbi:hypothetical protein L2D08_17135 [Domibacillus sp. PGB-M46]|uniref:hypothetical protein n=1 Tax=Domibacillus sp. PGB-M46 TaxID=2910255 RepID=UPI001F57F83C|nr:hypothetical protein [Domibacillus sp. PGB-M46]MCI2256079.1 hypothetical protein [Domibacillus sp. PGB-M46]